MTTSSQDRAFMESVIPFNFLEQAIDWIKCNLSPEDVFGDRDLQTWAEHYSSLNNEIETLKSKIESLEETILDRNLSL